MREHIATLFFMMGVCLCTSVCGFEWVWGWVFSACVCVRLFPEGAKLAVGRPQAQKRLHQNPRIPKKSTWGCQNPSNPKRPRNGPETAPKRARNGPETAPKRPRNGPDTAPTRPPVFPRSGAGHPPPPRPEDKTRPRSTSSLAWRPAIACSTLF